MEFRRWLPLLVVVVALGVILQLGFLVTFLLSLTIIFAFASFWQIRALRDVLYIRKPYYKRAFPGELVPLRIVIENKKILPLAWLRVQDPWPKAVGPDPENILAPTHLIDQGLLTNVLSLKWFERTQRDYILRFRRRGIYSVGPARLTSGDIFGLFESSREYGPSEHLTVFPNLLPVSDLGLPADDPFGDRRSRKRLYEDQNQPMGVRDYRPDDGFRRIHWPATAHTGSLQVRVFQPTSANMLVICLNVATFVRYWEGVNPDLLEHLIRVAASIIYRGIQDGYRVGLIANGCLANADQPFRIKPARTNEHLAKILEALAGIAPIVTDPFDRFLIREVSQVPYGASLIIITGVWAPEFSEALIRLKKHGRQIMILSCADQVPPTIPGFKIIHQPYESASVRSS